MITIASSTEQSGNGQVIDSQISLYCEVKQLCVLCLEEKLLTIIVGVRPTSLGLGPSVVAYVTGPGYRRVARTQG